MRYIRKSGNHYSIVKSSLNYGKFDDVEVARFIRDELVKNDWKTESIKEIYEFNDEYMIVRPIDGKIHLLCRAKTRPSRETIEKLYKKRLRNPNNSRYGLNITRVYDTFVIKKRIAGDDYIFGYYDNLEDAEFVRNHLLENDWNVESFPEIQYDDETDTYKAVEVIDDKAYVIASSKNDDIDIKSAREEFLNRITKHKMGLARHEHLGELTDKIAELEERFNVKAKDDVWNLNVSDNPLDAIFNLTPFQQSVYDAVDDSSFEEIKKSLARYKSKNFDAKIQRNLDELVELDLIEECQDCYKKRNF